MSSSIEWGENGGSITMGSCEDLEESKHAKHPELGLW